MPLAYSPDHGPGGNAATPILAVQVFSESDVLPESDVWPKANLDLKLVAVLRN